MISVDIFQNHIGEIITAIVGLGAWANERKKRKNDLKQQETQTQQGVVDLYQEALNDLKKRYDAKFQDLENEVKSLRTNLNLWKGKYKSLKTEFDEYKQLHNDKA